MCRTMRQLALDDALVTCYLFFSGQCTKLQITEHQPLVQAQVTYIRQQQGRSSSNTYTFVIRFWNLYYITVIYFYILIDPNVYINWIFSKINAKSKVRHRSFTQQWIHMLRFYGGEKEPCVRNKISQILEKERNKIISRFFFQLHNRN